MYLATFCLEPVERLSRGYDVIASELYCLQGTFGNYLDSLHSDPLIWNVGAMDFLFLGLRGTILYIHLSMYWSRSTWDPTSYLGQNILTSPPPPQKKRSCPNLCPISIPSLPEFARILPKFAQILPKYLIPELDVHWQFFLLFFFGGTQCPPPPPTVSYAYHSYYQTPMAVWEWIVGLPSCAPRQRWSRKRTTWRRWRPAWCRLATTCRSSRGRRSTILGALQGGGVGMRMGEGERGSQHVGKEHRIQRNASCYKDTCSMTHLQNIVGGSWKEILVRQ